MKKILHVALLSMAIMGNTVIAKADVATASTNGSKKISALFLMIKETDLSKIKIVRELQEKFSNFFRQLEEYDQNFRAKLSAEIAKVPQNDKAYSTKMKALEGKFNAHKEKMIKIRDDANEKMQNAINSINKVVSDELEAASKKYDNKAILKAESVIAHLPTECTTILDITDEVVERVNRKNVKIAVELPILG